MISNSLLFNFGIRGGKMIESGGLGIVSKWVVVETGQLFGRGSKWACMTWIRRLYATKGSLDDFEPCTHIPLLTILLFDPSEIPK